MAYTSFGVNDANTVKLWSNKTTKQIAKQSWFWNRMIGSSDMPIEKLTDFERQKGDRIRVRLRVLNTDAGVRGDTTAEGTETALVYYTDDVLLDRNRKAHQRDGALSDQRTTIIFREEARDALADWMSELIDNYITRCLSGDTTLSFNGTSVTALDSTRILYGGDATSTADLVAGDKMTLALVRKAKTYAKSYRDADGSPNFRPIKVDGGDHYVCLVHPYSVKDLKDNVTDGEWYSIQSLANVKAGSNPIFTGAVGMYDGVVLQEYDHILTDTDWGTGGTAASLDGCTNLFLGAQAGAVAFARYPKWVEKDDFDYYDKPGVLIDTLWGAKRTVYNSLDFSTINIKVAASRD